MRSLTVQDGQGLTPIMLAAREENHARINTLLSAKVPLTTRDNMGRTVLHYTNENSTPTIMHQLLQADPSLVEVKDKDGYTALQLAVIAGNKPIIEALLDKNADIMTTDNEGHTVAHWATVYGHADLLDLLEAGGATLAAPDRHRARPVHYAAQMCGASSADESKVGLTMLKKLIDKGLPLDQEDIEKRSPLLWAITAGSPNAVEMLVDAGAPVNSADRDGVTALHYSASKGYARCVDALLHKGANVDSMDKNGCTPAFYSVSMGHAHCTKRLLDAGARPDHRDSRGRTPSHCAATKGYLEQLRIIQEHDGDLWVKNNKGECPIHEASLAKEDETVDYLLVKNEAKVDIPNNDGRTCLHIAALSNNLVLAMKLVDRGASLNQGMKGQNSELTPYDVAKLRQHNETAEFLKTHGAKTYTEIIEEEKMVNLAQEESVGSVEEEPEKENEEAEEEKEEDRGTPIDERKEEEKSEEQGELADEKTEEPQKDEDVPAQEASDADQVEEQDKAPLEEMAEAEEESAEVEVNKKVAEEEEIEPEGNAVENVVKQEDAIPEDQGQPEGVGPEENIEEEQAQENLEDEEKQEEKQEKQQKEEEPQVAESRSEEAAVVEEVKKDESPEDDIKENPEDGSTKENANEQPQEDKTEEVLPERAEEEEQAQREPEAEPEVHPDLAVAAVADTADTTEKSEVVESGKELEGEERKMERQEEVAEPGETEKDTEQRQKEPLEDVGKDAVAAEEQPQKAPAEKLEGEQEEKVADQQQQAHEDLPQEAGQAVSPEEGQTDHLTGDEEKISPAAPEQIAAPAVAAASTAAIGGAAAVGAAGAATKKPKKGKETAKSPELEKKRKPKEVKSQGAKTPMVKSKDADPAKAAKVNIEKNQANGDDWDYNAPDGERKVDTWNKGYKGPKEREAIEGYNYKKPAGKSKIDTGGGRVVKKENPKDEKPKLKKKTVGAEEDDTKKGKEQLAADALGENVVNEKNKEGTNDPMEANEKAQDLKSRKEKSDVPTAIRKKKMAKQASGEVAADDTKEPKSSKNDKLRNGKNDPKLAKKVNKDKPAKLKEVSEKTKGPMSPKKEKISKQGKNKDSREKSADMPGSKKEGIDEVSPYIEESLLSRQTGTAAVIPKLDSVDDDADEDNNKNTRKPDEEKDHKKIGKESVVDDQMKSPRTRDDANLGDGKIGKGDDTQVPEGEIGTEVKPSNQKKKKKEIDKVTENKEPPTERLKKKKKPKKEAQKDQQPEKYNGPDTSRGVGSNIQKAKGKRDKPVRTEGKPVIKKRKDVKKEKEDNLANNCARIDKDSTDKSKKKQGDVNKSEERRDEKEDSVLLAEATENKKANQKAEENYDDKPLDAKSAESNEQDDKDNLLLAGVVGSIGDENKKLEDTGEDDIKMADGQSASELGSGNPEQRSSIFDHGVAKSEDKHPGEESVADAEGQNADLLAEHEEKQTDDAVTAPVDDTVTAAPGDTVTADDTVSAAEDDTVTATAGDTVTAAADDAVTADDTVTAAADDTVIADDTVTAAADDTVTATVNDTIPADEKDKSGGKLEEASDSTARLDDAAQVKEGDEEDSVGFAEKVVENEINQSGDESPVAVSDETGKPALTTASEETMRKLNGPSDDVSAEMDSMGPGNTGAEAENEMEKEEVPQESDVNNEGLTDKRKEIENEEEPHGVKGGDVENGTEDKSSPSDQAASHDDPAADGFETAAFDLEPALETGFIAAAAATAVGLGATKQEDAIPAASADKSGAPSADTDRKEQPAEHAENAKDEADEDKPKPKGEKKRKGKDRKAVEVLNREPTEMTAQPKKEKTFAHPSKRTNKKEKERNVEKPMYPLMSLPFPVSLSAPSEILASAPSRPDKLEWENDDKMVGNADTANVMARRRKEKPPSEAVEKTEAMKPLTKRKLNSLRRAADEQDLANIVWPPDTQSSVKEQLDQMFSSPGKQHNRRKPEQTMVASKQAFAYQDEKGTLGRVREATSLRQPNASNRNVATAEDTETVIRNTVDDRSQNDDNNANLARLLEFPPERWAQRSHMPLARHQHHQTGQPKLSRPTTMASGNPRHELEAAAKKRRKKRKKKEDAEDGEERPKSLLDEIVEQPHERTWEADVKPAPVRKRELPKIERRINRNEIQELVRIFEAKRSALSSINKSRKLTLYHSYRGGMPEKKLVDHLKLDYNVGQRMETKGDFANVQEWERYLAEVVAQAESDEKALRTGRQTGSRHNDNEDKLAAAPLGVSGDWYVHGCAQPSLGAIWRRSGQALEDAHRRGKWDENSVEAGVPPNQLQSRERLNLFWKQSRRHGGERRPGPVGEPSWRACHTESGRHERLTDAYGPVLPTEPSTLSKERSTLSLNVNRIADASFYSNTSRYMDSEPGYRTGLRKQKTDLAGGRRDLESQNTADTSLPYLSADAAHQYTKHRSKTYSTNMKGASHKGPSLVVAKPRLKLANLTATSITTDLSKNPLATGTSQGRKWLEAMKANGIRAIEREKSNLSLMRQRSTLCAETKPKAGPKMARKSGK